MSKLKFHRTQPGAYYADGESRRYTVQRQASGWLLRVYSPRVTAGVINTIGLDPIDHSKDDTKALAVAVADAYEALGDDYLAHEHGHRNRMTTAISDAYSVEQHRVVNV